MDIILKIKQLKISLIILSILILAFIVVQIFAMRSRTRIEKYPFTVIKTFSKFEIRNYEARLFTAVELPTNEYEKASGKGFSILAGYIFGGNKTNEKISMTSPVAMTLEDSISVMFMVPKSMKKENLPEPNQSDIKFREEPAKTVAAISFGGWANSSNIDKYKSKLIKALDAEGISHTNKFYFLGYNPPYDILNRKNEIIVELEKSFDRNIQTQQ